MNPIPNDAVEIVKRTWETGSRKIAQYYLDGQEVGYRYWEPSGVLVIEFGVKDGVKHGRYRHWHDNGKLCEEGSYYEGKEHGETRQYDHNGRQIGSYVMRHGTGLDLWFSSSGILAEERECRDGNRHGFERWWNGDNRTVNEESHYWNGTAHGIFRKWNMRGRLSRGYPQYFVMGKQVTKRQYVRACQGDSTLPPFVASDDEPTRNLPDKLLRSSPIAEE